MLDATTFLAMKIEEDGLSEGARGVNVMIVVGGTS
jgi:hypothetical protein